MGEHILALEMDAVCHFETLVLTYHTTQYHNTEDYNMNLYCHEPQILNCKLQFTNMVEELTTEPEY